MGALLKNRDLWLYLVAFPAGHGAVDWGSAAFWLLAPAMAIAMDLSPVQIGLLFAIRQLGYAAQLPAGLIGDATKNRGQILAATFWWVAIAQFAA